MLFLFIVILKRYFTKVLIDTFNGHFNLFDGWKYKKPQRIVLAGKVLPNVKPHKAVNIGSLGMIRYKLEILLSENFHSTYTYL